MITATITTVKTVPVSMLLSRSGLLEASEIGLGGLELAGETDGEADAEGVGLGRAPIGSLPDWRSAVNAAEATASGNAAMISKPSSPAVSFWSKLTSAMDDTSAWVSDFGSSPRR